jgi:hypothetical protein
MHHLLSTAVMQRNLNPFRVFLIASQPLFRFITTALRASYNPLAQPMPRSPLFYGR